MATLASLRTELANRLGDTGHTIWTSAEKDGYLNFAIKGLYPAAFTHRIASTVAGVGPVQVAPAGARNLYFVAHQRSGSTRARPVRGWAEGDGSAFVPKTGITGDTLVWGWTEGFDVPETDTELLTIPTHAEEIVLLRAQIAALEKLLSDRINQEKYHALQVRQGVTEEDVATTLEALHASLNERLRTAPPLPEIRG